MTQSNAVLFLPSVFLLEIFICLVQIHKVAPNDNSHHVLWPSNEMVRIHSSIEFFSPCAFSVTIKLPTLDLCWYFTDSSWPYKIQRRQPASTSLSRTWNTGCYNRPHSSYEDNTPTGRRTRNTLLFLITPDFHGFCFSFLKYCIKFPLKLTLVILFYCLIINWA